LRRLPDFVLQTARQPTAILTENTLFLAEPALSSDRRDDQRAGST